MKSAYELAMERLQQEDAGEALILTDEQKEELAEIDRKYQSQLAEREIFLKQQLETARQSGSHDEVAQIEKQLQSERARIEEEKEAAKDKVRAKAKVQK